MNNKKVKVLKFGGGCLKSAKDFSAIATILREEKNFFPVVIVSALFGVTNFLLQFFEDIKEERVLSSHKLEKIHNYHLTIIQSLNINKDVKCHIIQVIDNLTRLLEEQTGIILQRGLFDESSRASVICFGERYSSIILSHYLTAVKIPAKAYFSEDCGLVAQKVSAQAKIDMKSFNVRFPLVKRKLLKGNRVPVITGFYGITRDNKITTFGRNGSDYTAAVIASGFNAVVLEFWKDSDGFLSADPKVVQNPLPLKMLSFEEVEELTYYGAKILHPETIEPVRKLSTEVRIKSFYKPSMLGTIISHKKNENSLKSITYNDDITIIRIYQKSNTGKSSTLSARLNKFQAKGTDIISSLVTLKNAILIVSEKNLPMVINKISDSFPESNYLIEVKKDVSLIAVVGMGLIEPCAFFEQILKTFSKKGIRLECFTSGVSSLTTVFIVNKKMATSAINELHCELFSETSAVSNTLKL